MSLVSLFVFRLSLLLDLISFSYIFPTLYPFFVFRFLPAAIPLSLLRRLQHSDSLEKHCQSRFLVGVPKEDRMTVEREN